VRLTNTLKKRLVTGLVVLALIVTALTLILPYVGGGHGGITTVP
jgi:hypothetical protein